MKMPSKQMAKGVSSPFFLFILLHGLYAFTPMIRQTQIAMYIDFALVLLWALRMLLSNRAVSHNSNMRQVIRISFIILAISLIYKFTGYSTAKIGQCIRYFGFFATMVIGWYFIKKSSDKQKKKMLACYSVIILINVVYNIIVTMPYVAMGMGTEEIVKAVGSSIPNFGDTSFTGYVFFCGVLFFIFVCYDKGILNRISFLVLVAACSFYTIVCGMRGTTSFLLIVALFLIFISRFLRRWIGKQHSLMIAMVIVVVILLINIDFVTDLLIQVAPSERLADRFRDVQQTSEHGISDDSLSGRGSLFQISINSFLKSPFTILFGIGEPFVEGSYVKAGISNHSDIIDTFAKSGLLGVLLYIRCFILYYKEMTKAYRNSDYDTLFKIVFWMVPLYGLVKTIFWENFAIVTFIMLPLTLYLISTKKDANYFVENY